MENQVSIASQNTMANVPQKKQEIINVISSQLIKRQDGIQKMLPANMTFERVLRMMRVAVSSNPDILKCEIPSVVGGLVLCAQMALECNTPLGQAYLIPFKISRKRLDGGYEKVTVAQVVIGYKGLIELARRSGQILNISAHEVCENDKFDFQYGLNEKLDHSPALKNRGNIIAFYAVARFINGGHAFEVMSFDDINRLKNSSPSKAWKESFSEMGRKTAIRRLSKFLPASNEFQKGIALNDMATLGQNQNLESAMDEDFSVAPVYDVDGPQAEEKLMVEPTPGLLDDLDQCAEEKGLKALQKIAESIPEPEFLWMKNSGDYDRLMNIAKATDARLAEKPIAPQKQGKIFPDLRDPIDSDDIPF